MKNFSISRPNEEDLKKVLSERILIMDGAMGTMIQQEKLTEDDFRGDLFKKHPDELKGNNDLLSLTRPEIIRNIHKDILMLEAIWLKLTLSVQPLLQWRTIISRKSSTI